MKTSIKTQIIPAAATLALQQEMWQLYLKYYKVQPSAFFNRFTSHNYYAIYTKANQIVGFTGIRLKEVETTEGKVQTLYLGQTVMDKQVRSRSLLPKMCIQLFLKHYLTRPTQPIYVWCDALTYKPYLLFANSLDTFYPSRKQEMTTKVKSILDQLGETYYGENYDAANGTVQKSTNIINDVTATITTTHLQHPDIAFFAKANSNYRQGHGLLVIAPMSIKNFIHLVVKCLKKRFVK